MAWGVLEWLFWLCALGIVYAYAGFPLLVFAWGSLRRYHVRKADITPGMTLIVAAYNEEQSIAEKIENSLALDYPPEALQILIGSDGSTDQTEAIVRRYESRGVRLLSLPRSGKIHVLSRCVEEATGEILVFSDANTRLDSRALRMLARNFADNTVGGVCGNQVYGAAGGGDSSGAGERLYWSYDKWLKALQTWTGSIVAADGAIYAIRRRLFRMPPDTAVTDDFGISTHVVEAGHRLVFEADAVAYEQDTGAAPREFRRKVRIMNRGLRGVIMRRRLLNPFRYGFYSLILFSHKLWRRLVPLLLLTLLATSAVLATTTPRFGFFFGTQLAFYAVAVLGWSLRQRRLGRTRLLMTPFYYCLANAAALVALCDLALGKRIECWEPQRHGASASRPA